MASESLQLNGHTFTHFHASLDRARNTLAVITEDPYLLPMVRTRPTVLRCEYRARGAVYELEGGVVKWYDYHLGKYTLIFETIVEAS